MLCQRGGEGTHGDPPRGQDERGWALIPEELVGRPLQTQLQRPVLTEVTWVKQARQETHSRDWGKG